MTALTNASRFLIRPGALPLVLMLGALSSVFLFGHDRGHFYRDGNHDWITSQGLAQAVNLSLADGLLLFVDRTHDADGDLTYSTYARWPIGSYALVKLAVLPFEGDLSAAIYASRIASLLFFAAAAVVAYLAFARLVGRWVALTATLLTFSSQFALYYSDAFAPDVMPALFGLLLTFHGMVVYVQEGRFVQLLMKSCLALLMCWQSYALLLPFVVLGFMHELVRDGGISSSWTAISRRSISILRSSRHLLLGLATLSFGIVLLCFNVANEYMALNGKVPVLELPTVQSLGIRFGIDEDLNVRSAETAWYQHIKQQLHRVAVMTLPFYASVDGNLQTFGLLLLAYGCVAVAVQRHRTVLASLLFSGVVWAFALRLHVAFHEHQGLIHIGIPLVVISFTVAQLHRYVVYAGAGLATLLFVLSSVKMAAVGHDPVQARQEGEMLKDFQVIRSIVGDGTVFIPIRQTDPFGGAPLAPSYFMTGSVIEYSKFRLAWEGGVDKLIRGRLDLADYTLSDRRLDVSSLVTAENKHIFLYDNTCDRACQEATLTRFQGWGENPWVTFLKDGHVIMANEKCTNTNMQFFVHYTVPDTDSRDSGRVNGAAFIYRNYRWDEYDTCAVKFELPNVEIIHIRVGQLTDDLELIWSKDAFVHRD